MKIYYSSKFVAGYKKLPSNVKKLAEQKEQIFRKNPFDPRLETHKLKGSLKGFLSFSIDKKYRIVFEIVNPNMAWFHLAGDHSIYKSWE